MLITKVSGFTGKENSMELDITAIEYETWLAGGLPIQLALPHLTASEREFLITGVTPAEWDAVFGKDIED